MKTEMDGLVLTEQTTDDESRYIRILTRKQGVISCYARGSKNIKKSIFAPTQPLCYSRFELFSGKRGYIIDDAELNKSFYDLRVSVEKLALAQYICELILKNIGSGVSASEHLDLALNSLYVLEGNEKPLELVKAVFELRLAELLGFMPNVLYCEKCGAYESDIMYYELLKNCLYCSDCCDGNENMLRLSKGALAAVRYILLAEPKKLFSFSISQESLEQLAQFAEGYMLSVSLSYPKTIDYYKQITSMM